MRHFTCDYCGNNIQFAPQRIKLSVECDLPMPVDQEELFAVEIDLHQWCWREIIEGWSG